MVTERNDRVRVLYSFPLRLGADRICYTAWQQVNGLAAAGADLLVFPASLGRPVPAGVKVLSTLAWGNVRLPYRVVGTARAVALHDRIVARRIEKLAGGKEAESEASNIQSLTPIDTFPPAAPTGLHASVAAGSIELTWQQNTESDLAGYIVYRAVGNGAFERLAQVAEIPSYSDHAVEAGKTYRYAVSAIDRANNESGRSEAVEVVMQ